MPDSDTKSPEIPKAYDPKAIEARWADFWVKEKLAEPEASSKKPPFVIVIPPPNVTGSLHMGHALNNTLQDILIRWKKMSGFDALWVPGTDHGGIATQNVVEKLLKSEKKSRYDLGREKFLERLWQWKKESGDTILMQLRRLGCMLDWSRTHFTMDEKCSQAVLRAFLDLYKKGWIYRGKRMVNWCVRCRTALSDIEVEFEERKDKLYHIRYPILSGKADGWQGKPLVVATTRPETLLGDTAVAVHPDDPRYEKIHGWWVQLPLVDKEIAVISDAAVDPKFGTGVVKVTPAHDPADFEMGERHHLEQVVVIGFDGKMTPEAGRYAGLSREECRKKILEDLEAQGLVEKIEDYPHSVGTCYRCGTVIEPLVSDQWFLNTKEMSKEAGDATRKGGVKIFPDSWTKPYLLWMDNLRDWCISRQIWWGHRIPIWYCVPGEGPEHPSLRTSCPPVASADSPGKCGRHGDRSPEETAGQHFEQEPDVLDTWFSSALWPFSVFDWPDPVPEFKKYYPTSVLVTGHEILYLWVARMVMFGLAFQKKVPFSQVFIHGIVRDKSGKKMSKSLGNVVDPLVMMEKYGTDALRFVLASQSVPGRDLQISDDSFVGARNFANKIWNMSRFVFMNRGTGPASKDAPLELCDRWILSRFQETARSVTGSLESYNIAQASRTLYQFLWSEFCDWYVELAKARMKESLWILEQILSGSLRLLHPIMPFITEELWRGLGRTGSLLLEEYPEPEPKWMDKEAEEQMAVLMDVVSAVRTVRSEMNVPPGNKIALVLSVAEDSQKSFYQEHLSYIRHLCKAENISIGKGLAKPLKAATAMVRRTQIFVPLEGLIDFDKEKTRLAKEVQGLEADLEKLKARLSNPDFKKNAPVEEVQKAEARQAESAEKLGRMRDLIASF
ncbi:MAG: valine--tRNA ligase [Elusimicrobia bacterium RIFCSPLOWO2_01_FULL_60_11]|nr:MAG: valine--tRNA ligase [Elusimicrobia bacterium RIFCSPLOWO2_01_FULL_60_11]